MNTNLETQTASQSVDEVLSYTETVMKSTIVDAVKAQVDKYIKPLSDELSAGKTAMRNLLTSKGVSYKDTDSLSELAAKLSAACLTLGGCELAEGCEWSMDALVSGGYGNILRVLKTDGTSINTPSSKCESIVAPNLTSAFRVADATSIKNISVPKLSALTYGYLTNDRYWPLRHLYCDFTITETTWNCHINLTNQLYDFRLGTVRTVSYDCRQWKASTALYSTSQSLTPRDEWDTHPSTVTFNNNLEKFLWYFEHRFMPSFATIPSTAEKPTLTLSTAVYEAISASTAVAHNADGSTMYATADYSDFGTYDEAAGRTTAVTLLKALEKKQNWNVANA